MLSLLWTGPGAMAAYQEGTRRLEMREMGAKGAKRIREGSGFAFLKFSLQPGLCAAQGCSPEIRAGCCCLVSIWDTLLSTCRNETCVNQHNGEIINYSQHLLNGNVRKEG